MNETVHGVCIVIFDLVTRQVRVTYRSGVRVLVSRRMHLHESPAAAAARAAKGYMCPYLWPVGTYTSYSSTQTHVTTAFWAMSVAGPAAPARGAAAWVNVSAVHRLGFNHMAILADACRMACAVPAWQRVDFASLIGVQPQTRDQEMHHLCGSVHAFLERTVHFCPPGSIAGDMLVAFACPASRITLEDLRELRTLLVARNPTMAPYLRIAGRALLLGPAAEQ